ncbi:Membrane-bound lysozyme-inhibitor of c-type lysozyme [Xylophilus ampelinus]|nr:MliC family protein [Variovorax sp.]VTY36959.1 Membrane-bound lysozyme-inhibitor of c-type lysozyme [Xylophilus ampelinus]
MHRVAICPAAIALYGATASALSAAAPLATAAPAKAITAVYACDDGSTLRVRFAGNIARVTLPGRPRMQVDLLQQRSGSGFIYATPRYELRGKGDDGTWTVGSRAPLHCSVKR